jgi:hypothetical protein
MARVVRSILCWLAKSIREPDNIPYYLTAIFTLALAILAYYAWNEAKGGTKALRGQLEAMQSDQRPWITVTEINVVGKPTLRDGRPFFPRIQYIIKNVGRSAGFVRAGSFTITGPDKGWEGQQAELCDKLSSSEINTWLVIPGGEFSYMFPDSTIESQSLGSRLDDIGGKSTPKIFGCVVYRSVDIADRAVHKTGFVATVYAIDQKDDPRDLEKQGAGTSGEFGVPLPEGKVLKTGFIITAGKGD